VAGALGQRRARPAGRHRGRARRSSTQAAPPGLRTSGTRALQAACRPAARSAAGRCTAGSRCRRRPPHRPAWPAAAASAHSKKRRPGKSNKVTAAADERAHGRHTPPPPSGTGQKVVASVVGQHGARHLPQDLRGRCAGAPPGSQAAQQRPARAASGSGGEEQQENLTEPSQGHGRDPYGSLQGVMRIVSIYNGSPCSSKSPSSSVRYPRCRPRPAVQGGVVRPARRRHRRADRPLRLRQDHLAARSGRPGAGQRRRASGFGAEWWAAPPAQLAPEARRIGMVFQDYALFPHLDGGRQRGLRHAPHLPARRACDAGRRGAASWSGLAGSAAPTTRTSCPAASSSAWPWRAPWRRARACCCWTSPSPTWTWSCASAWRMRCATSSRPAQATALFVDARPAGGLCHRRHASA